MVKKVAHKKNKNEFYDIQEQLWLVKHYVLP